MELKQRQSRRQSEAKPLKNNNTSRRNKTSRVHRGDADSASNGDSVFRSFLPSPLRHCLAGNEIKRKGALVEDATTAASTAATSSRSIPQNVSDMKEKSLSERSLSPSELDFSNNATPGNHECYTSVSSMTSENVESEYDFETSDKGYSFLMFRLSYLFVTLVVMLADGLQGTESCCFLMDVLVRRVEDSFLHLTPLLLRSIQERICMYCTKGMGSVSHHCTVWGSSPEHSPLPSPVP
jgi:hypothetical protein